MTLFYGLCFVCFFASSCVSKVDICKSDITFNTFIKCHSTSISQFAEVFRLEF